MIHENKLNLSITSEECDRIIDKIPNYENNHHSFEYFAYQGTTDGTWTIGGEKFDCGEDFRSVARMKEFKEAGLHVIYTPAACGIGSHEKLDFENHSLKKLMDCAAEAGVKVIILDFRLWDLVYSADGGLIGDDKPFVDEHALDAKVEELMGQYVKHAAFYGVSLTDEAHYPKFVSLGQVYRSIKRVFPNTFILCNLCPPVGGTVGRIFPVPEEEAVEKFSGYYGKILNVYATNEELQNGEAEVRYGKKLAQQFAAFTEYLSMFLKETGSVRICYDQYPMLGTRLHSAYFGGLQVAAEFAKKNNVELHIVTQTSQYETTHNKEFNTRLVSEPDCRWLNNTLLGFGAKKIGYWTYFTRMESNEREVFLDGGSYITHYGEKTPIYYIMQKIHQENQKFAPTILSFDYSSSAVFFGATINYPITNSTSCIPKKLEKIDRVFVDKEAALITELYDAKNGEYMYMIQNVIDPLYKGESTCQTVEVNFNDDYNYIAVYKNGEKEVLALTERKYLVQQYPGEAVFVIPFKA